MKARIFLFAAAAIVAAECRGAGAWDCWANVGASRRGRYLVRGSILYNSRHLPLSSLKDLERPAIGPLPTSREQAEEEVLRDCFRVNQYGFTGPGSPTDDQVKGLKAACAVALAAAIQCKAR